jgi:hypothetical protein
MNPTAEVWAVIGAAFVTANLPFLSERLLLVGPRRAPKPFGWRLVELALLAVVAYGFGALLEARIGQRSPQGWEFYAAGLCLYATFAFPGFVWRYLRRRRDG